MLKSRSLISIILVLAMIFTFAACASQITDDPLITTGATTTAGTTAATTTAATTDPNNGGDDNPPPEPSAIKNLIIIIGDGMGPEHIAAGQLINGEAYEFTKWHNTNVNTDSVTTSGIAGILTDSAASATALATGTLTYNGYLGMDHKKQNLETIMDVAKSMGKATGVITTDNLYGATPSGFSAHSSNRNDSNTITTTQIDSGVDFLCGLRNDNHYLPFKTKIEEKGYYFSTSAAGLISSIPKKDKVYLTLDIENSATGAVSLSQVATSALKFLERDEDGFVLMIEQAHIDKYAHSNNMSGVISSMDSLAATVTTVMNWIGDREDTAVIITADHETGGLTVSSQKIFASKYTVRGNTVYYNFSTGDHTDHQVKVFTYGIKPDFSSYSYYGANHLIKNINVFDIMKQALNKELLFEK